MTTRYSKVLLSERVPRVACALVTAIGTLAFSGWVFGISAFRTVIPGLPPMVPLTALSLVLGGLSLWMLADTKKHLIRRVPGILAALTITTVGALMLGEYVFRSDLGIDRLLLPMLPSGRPSHYTALCLLLLGLSLLLLDVQTRRDHRPAQVLALTAALTAGLALTGQIIGYAPFYQTSKGTGMAVHTAVAIIVFAAGVLFARPGGLTAIITSRDAAGATARRLLPLPLVLTFILSWIGLAGGRAGFYDRVVGTWLLQLANVVIFTLLIWLNASLLHRSDLERRRTLQALQESEQRFRKVFEDGPLGMALLSLEYEFTKANPALCYLLGYTEEELRQRTLSNVTHPEDRCTDEAIGRLNNGDIPVFQSERRCVTKYNETITVHLTATIIRDHQTSPAYALALFEDVSARRQAEQALKGRTAQLEMVNKELETFSYSVSHDLRAPLRHIDGFAELLLKRAGAQLDATSLRFAKTICESAREMGQLIDDLLVFSRMGRSEMCRTTVDLENLVKEVIRQCCNQAQGREINWKVGRLNQIPADPAMLRLALTNLISNAVKYTRPRAKAEIEIACQYRNSQEAIYFVRDNGVGFDMHYVDKLFGVFQRLHAAKDFEGTGIGLANVRRIIHRHGGRTWAEGAVDAGATFYFSLPINGEETT